MREQNGLTWLRGLGVKEHDRARNLADVANQRAHDITTLCDALEGFYEHPNVDDADRLALDDALGRLFDDIVEEQIAARKEAKR